MQKKVWIFIYFFNVIFSSQNCIQEYISDAELVISSYKGESFLQKIPVDISGEVYDFLVQTIPSLISLGQPFDEELDAKLHMQYITLYSDRVVENLNNYINSVQVFQNSQITVTFEDKERVIYGKDALSLKLLSQYLYQKSKRNILLLVIGDGDADDMRWWQNVTRNCAYALASEKELPVFATFMSRKGNYLDEWSMARAGAMLSDWVVNHMCAFGIVPSRIEKIYIISYFSGCGVVNGYIHHQASVRNLYPIKTSIMQISAPVDYVVLNDTVQKAIEQIEDKCSHMRLTNWYSPSDEQTSGTIYTKRTYLVGIQNILVKHNFDYMNHRQMIFQLLEQAKILHAHDLIEQNYARDLALQAAFFQARPVRIDQELALSFQAVKKEPKKSLVKKPNIGFDGTDTISSYKEDYDRQENKSVFGRTYETCSSFVGKNTTSIFSTVKHLGKKTSHYLT